MAVAEAHHDACYAVCNSPRQPLTRPTKQPSWELANHAKSYLEAGEYAKGYSLLQSILSAGTSISVPAKPYTGLLAPAAQIAFAASLVIYPSITTKTTSHNALKGSDAALQYLRCVHNTIEGPAYKVVRNAFTFPEERTRRRAAAWKDDEIPSPGAGGDVERVDVKQATVLSLWHCADDFWHAVGWAFNCSVVHKKRWARWKLWLEVMLDFLETDWDTCVKDSNEFLDRNDVLQGSLIWSYISSENPTSRTTRRRICAAILARADKKSQKDFPEVWNKETADSRPQDDDVKKPNSTLDFETGQLGDYENDDEDAAMLDAPRSIARDCTRRASIASTESNTVSIATYANAVEKLGGRDAVRLRQRLVSLVAKVALELPAQFTELEDFCDNFVEQLDVKHMPTSLFSVIISSLNLPQSIHFAFHANILPLLVQPKVQNYFVRVPTQEDLEAQLLPLRSTSQSFAHNAKVSLILEQMLLYMIHTNIVTPTNSLRVAVENGIKARQKVHGSGKGKKGNAEEEEQAKEIMEATSSRILGLLSLMEIGSDDARRLLNKRRSNNPKAPLQQLSSFGSSLSSVPSDMDGDD